MTKREARDRAWDAWKAALMSRAVTLTGEDLAAFAKWWRDREKSKRVRSG